MTVPDNQNRYSAYNYRTKINYNSCSWLGLLQGWVWMVDEDGNGIAPDGVIVSQNSSLAFARVELLAKYRARGYMTEEDVMNYNIKPDPEEWTLDYDVYTKKTTFRARALDAPPRKTN